MIALGNSGGGQSLFGSGMLLDDLIHYVYEGEGCRLLLSGDTAQLPPVGEEDSLALRADVLASYGLRVRQIDLTEVVRQSRTSDVLSGATLPALALYGLHTNNRPPVSGKLAGKTIQTRELKTSASTNCQFKEVTLHGYNKETIPPYATPSGPYDAAECRQHETQRRLRFAR